MINKKYKLLNFFTIIFIIIFISAPYNFAASFLIIPLFLYYESRVFFLKIKSTEDFNINNEERKKIKSLEKNLYKNLLTAKKIENNLLSLIIKSKGVKKNKNGMFNARSSLGKFLNKEVPKLEKELSLEQDSINNISAELNNKKKAPLVRAKKWIYYISIRNGFRIQIIALFFLNFINVNILYDKQKEFLISFLILYVLIIFCGIIFMYKKINKGIFST